MIYYETELYHHGVKGMKWGVRRYQNKNGSLTAEGRRRYAPVTDTKHENDKLFYARQIAQRELIDNGSEFESRYGNSNSVKKLVNISKQSEMLKKQIRQACDSDVKRLKTNSEFKKELASKLSERTYNDADSFYDNQFYWRGELINNNIEKWLPETSKKLSKFDNMVAERKAVQGNLVKDILNESGDTPIVNVKGVSVSYKDVVDSMVTTQFHTGLYGSSRTDFRVEENATLGPFISYELLPITYEDYKKYTP